MLFVRHITSSLRKFTLHKIPLSIEFFFLNCHLPALVQISYLKKKSSWELVAQAYNLATWEAEISRIEVQSQPQANSS
jgi:hypothetical protein